MEREPYKWQADAVCAASKRGGNGQSCWHGTAVLSPYTASLSHVKNCLLPQRRHCWGHRALLSHIIHSQLLSPPCSRPWLTPETAWKFEQFWEEALSACMPIEYHNQMMTTDGVSVGSDPCMCLLWHILQWPLRKENAVRWEQQQDLNMPQFVEINTLRI